MSIEKGASDIGKCPGFAMAASEDMRPVPSVEEPEGADIPIKGDMCYTADNLFDRQNSLNTTAIHACFLEPYTRSK